MSIHQIISNKESSQTLFKQIITNLAFQEFYEIIEYKLKNPISLMSNLFYPDKYFYNSKISKYKERIK